MKVVDCVLWIKIFLKVITVLKEKIVRFFNLNTEIQNVEGEYSLLGTA